MAFLSRIAVFPIKALDGITVAQAGFVRGGGLEHDRQYAMFTLDGRYVNGKNERRVHEVRASFNFDVSEVTLTPWNGVLPRASFSLHDRRALESWLSAYFAYPVEVRRDDERGFPDDVDAAGPTLISTATLREIASWFNGMTLDEARARFRATLEIDGVPPFWEDQLYGSDGLAVPFAIGSVQFEGTNSSARCVVPSRDPRTGVEIQAFSKTFSERRIDTLPPWAPVSRFDHFYRASVNTRVPVATSEATIRVGDPIVVCVSGESIGTY
jgi:uncharacterized protein